MAKRPKMSNRQVKDAWKKLPEADRRFMSGVIRINQAVGDDKLRYGELPPKLEQLLRKSNRNTLFSIMTECLGILTKAPAMDRVRGTHQRRKTLGGSEARRTPRTPKSGGR